MQNLGPKTTILGKFKGKILSMDNLLSNICHYLFKFIGNLQCLSHNKDIGKTEELKQMTKSITYHLLNSLSSVNTSYKLIL